MKLSETYWLLIMRSAETVVVAAKMVQMVLKERILTDMMKRKVYRMRYRNIIHAKLATERKKRVERPNKQL